MTTISENSHLSDPIAIAAPVSSSAPTSDLRDVAVEDSSSTQITSYADASEHLEMSKRGVTPNEMWRATNTLPNQDLMTVLSRSYQLGIVAWASQGLATDLSGFSNLDVLLTLLAIPQIAEKVAYYKYFRCRAVRLTLRVNATPWHYGCLALSSTVNNSWEYHNNSATSAPLYLNNNCVLVDANRMESIDYEIPWCSNLQWFDVKSLTPTQLMTFRLSVAVPLSMIGTSLTSAQVSVFASFVEPEVSFPVADSLVPPIEFFAFMHRTNPEAREKTSNNSVAGTIRSVTDTVMSVVGEVTGLLNAGSAIVGLMDKPTGLAPVQHIVVLPGTSMSHTKGLDTTVKLAADPEASAGFSSNSMGDPIGNPQISQLVQTPGAVDGFSWTTGTAAGTKLWSLPLDPNVMTLYIDEDPTFYYMPSPLMWYAQLFRFWRGGFKFFMHFVGSAFITSRLRLVWIPAGLDSPTTLTANETGDYVSKVFEVTGSMDMEFTIPYISDSLYRDVGVPDEALYDRLDVYSEATGIGELAIYLVNASVSVNSTLTPTMTALVWASAAPDFQFSNLSNSVSAGTDTDYVFAPGGSPEFKAHTSVLKAFEKDFQPIVAHTSSKEFGLATSEQYFDLVSLGKRYESLPLRPYVAGSYVYPFFWGEFFLLANQDLGAWSFHSWLTAGHVNFRGSTRWKVFWNSANTAYPPVSYGAAGVPATPYKMADPPLFVTTGESKFLEFEYPWQTKLPWFYRGVAADELGVNGYSVLPFTDASVLVQVGIRSFSFGDDFAVGVLQALPLIQVTDTSSRRSKRKLKGTFVTLKERLNLRRSRLKESSASEREARDTLNVSRVIEPSHPVDLDGEDISESAPSVPRPLTGKGYSLFSRFSSHTS